MRPLRLLLSLSLCTFTVLAIFWCLPRRNARKSHYAIRQHNSYSGLLNWHAPPSLFPMSAVISLTEDNSTFFLARPADFGPSLPHKSLTAPLWVGKGFGDDHLNADSAIEGEGELGCSDVPGWDEHDSHVTAGDHDRHEDGIASSSVKGRWSKRGSIDTTSETDGAQEIHVHADYDNDDGTDDHLYSSTMDTTAKNTGFSPTNKRPIHADIQSLQETAEIRNKIVLLSRGGCGFLDKVNWAQRRGAAAVIVGDDIRGEGLITMYARGDTSNVSIPAIFTSHTTAQLLASLMPADGTLGKTSRLPKMGSRVGTIPSSGHEGNTRLADDRPNFTATTKTNLPTSSASWRNKKIESHASHQTLPNPEDTHHFYRLMRRFFHKTATPSQNDDSRRPPSSGSARWSEKKSSFGSSKLATHEAKLAKPISGFSTDTRDHRVEDTPDDNFVIGVQDWRDPDVLDGQEEAVKITSGASTATRAVAAQKSSAGNLDRFAGGSTTPGSGRYLDINNMPKNGHQGSTHPQQGESHTDQTGVDGKRLSFWTHAWMSLFSSTHTGKGEFTDSQGKGKHPSSSSVESTASKTASSTSFDLHDGDLWVTLTPTPMSSSPFFDTLLVLVVSPLVTLTIVYALLILRSRIRRRRWRAPKSVVERLPVRTYQTMPSSTSTRRTSPAPTPRTDVTTPLLPTTARPILNAPMQMLRSSGTSNSDRQGSSPTPSNEMASPSPDHIEEKRAAGLAEWRRKYGGKQRECVVCLEEYVDGVSRVMSLPCGHEFHAECITPWLTTRRRTCPICKGDVVRSLARASTSAAGSFFSPPSSRYRDDADEPPTREQNAPIFAETEDELAHDNTSLSELEDGISNNRS